MVAGGLVLAAFIPYLLPDLESWIIDSMQHYLQHTKLTHGGLYRDLHDLQHTATF